MQRPELNATNQRLNILSNNLSDIAEKAEVFVKQSALLDLFMSSLVVDAEFDPSLKSAFPAILNTFYEKFPAELIHWSASSLSINPTMVSYNRALGTFNQKLHEELRLGADAAAIPGNADLEHCGVAFYGLALNLFLTVQYGGGAGAIHENEMLKGYRLFHFLEKDTDTNLLKNYLFLLAWVELKDLLKKDVTVLTEISVIKLYEQCKLTLERLKVLIKKYLTPYQGALLSHYIVESLFALSRKIVDIYAKGTHLTNTQCQIFISLEEKIKGLEIDFQQEMQEKAKKITHVETKELIELLSFVNFEKPISSQLSEQNRLRAKLLGYKKVFYQENFPRRLRDLQDAVLNYQWPTQLKVDATIINVLPDAIHLVSLVLDKLKNRLMQSIQLIDLFLKKYSSFMPQGEKLNDYFVENLLIFKKDCLLGLRVINEMRYYHSLRLVIINFKQGEVAYRDWHERLQMGLDVKVDEVNQALAKFNETRTSNQTVNDAQLAKYYTVLNEALALLPKRKEYLRKEKPKSKNVTSEKLTAEEKKSEPARKKKSANAEDIFEKGYELSQLSYNKASEYYDKQAQNTQDLLIQAKLYYVHAEIIELELERLIAEQNPNHFIINKLREKLFKLCREARNNLLVLREDKPNYEVETWLGFVNDKLKSSPDDMGAIVAIEKQEAVFSARSPQSAQTLLPSNVPVSKEHFRACTLDALFSSQSAHVKASKKEIANIITILNKEKIKYYLFGGIVRDHLLGKDFYDVDISVEYDSLENLKKCFPYSKVVGKRHPILLVSTGLITFEISLVAKNVNGQFDLDFDTAKRFIAIDSLVFDPQRGVILDFHQARNDFSERVIRLLAGGASVLLQHPVNLLRIIRHAARYQLALDPVIEDLFYTCKLKMLACAEDNSHTELHKLLTRGYANAALRLLDKYHLLDLFVPGLQPAFNESANLIMKNFVLGAINFYDEKMQMSYRLGIRSSLSVEFIYTIILWPHFSSQINFNELLVMFRANQKWDHAFHLMIEKVINENPIMALMDFRVKRHIQIVWTLFVAREYNLNQDSLRFDPSQLQDAEVFRDFNVFANAGPRQSNTGLINPARTQVGLMAPKKTADETSFLAPKMKGSTP